MPKRRCHGCRRNAADASGLCPDCTKTLGRVAADVQAFAKELERKPAEELDAELSSDTPQLVF